MSTIPFPDIFESELDKAQLKTYFAELRTVAPIEIRTKHASQERSDGIAKLNLEEAHTLLVGGGVEMLQLRYDYDDMEWWDTLIPGPESTRIVRVRHDFGIDEA